jgi:HNH endonuclease
MSRGHVSGHQARQLRLQVLELYGATCWRCGQAIPLELSGLHPMGLTLGHVVPVRDGGRTDVANVRPEHRRCNLAERPVYQRAVVVRPSAAAAARGAAPAPARGGAGRVLARNARDTPARVSRGRVPPGRD